jgi:hypothetical protein
MKEFFDHSHDTDAEGRDFTWHDFNPIDRKWKSLWRLDRDIQVPHASVVVMCPYGFVRVLWHYCPKEFKAWPSTYETGVVLGWRWPFHKKFKERKWMKSQFMALPLYGPMDMVYLVRTAKYLGFEVPRGSNMEATRYVGPTIREIVQLEPRCAHNYWIASCEQCAKKALVHAIALYGQCKGDAVSLKQREGERLVAQEAERRTAHEAAKKEAIALGIPEDPLTAFQRREAEAKKRLGVGQ